MDPALGPKGINNIVWWYSEDNFFLESFESRSKRLLNQFLEYIEANARSYKTPYKVIYFHNLSRFDGIFLIRHLALNTKYKLKPLIRNNELYELAVYYDKGKKCTFRDSLKLLPASLDNLASTQN